MAKKGIISLACMMVRSFFLHTSKPIQNASDMKGEKF